MSYTKEQARERYKQLKLQIISGYESKCCLCGYNKCMSALELHHLNPSEKEFTISKNNIKEWNKIVIELKKCILLCSICHREFHSGMRQIDTPILFNENKVVKQFDLVAEKSKKAKDRLTSLLSIMSTKELAAHMGISVNALHHRCRRYKIPLNEYIELRKNISK